MIETPHPRTDDDADEAETGPGPEANYYQIDPSWFAENQLSFEDVVRARMCDSCQGRVGSEVESRVPVFDKATGRMNLETHSGIYGSDPLQVIRDHCGRAKNYIHRDMPTLEAIFRIFLANGNQPMTLEQVREQLAEWCPGGGCQWLLLPIETVERLVQNDTYYGLRQTLRPELASGS